MNLWARFIFIQTVLIPSFSSLFFLCSMKCGSVAVLIITYKILLHASWKCHPNEGTTSSLVLFWEPALFTNIFSTLVQSLGRVNGGSGVFSPGKPLDQAFRSLLLLSFLAQNLTLFSLKFTTYLIPFPLKYQDKKRSANSEAPSQNWNLTLLQ